MKDGFIYHRLKSHYLHGASVYVTNDDDGGDSCFHLPLISKKAGECPDNAKSLHQILYDRKVGLKFLLVCLRS